jgi:hypothetical protein
MQSTEPGSNSPLHPRPEVPAVLKELRGRIRRYVVMEGVAWIIGAVGVAFWISLGIDYLFEPGVGSRLALLMTATAGIAAMVVWGLILRLARSLKSRALALVLERRFPQLNDRLITTVELAEMEHPETGLTAAMLNRAADEAAQLTQQLSLREVFNLQPLARAIGIAAGVTVSVIGFRLAQADLFSTWMHRSLGLSEELYARDTDLKVFVVAEPGERIVEFRDGVYKHPRGSDLTIVAEATADSRIPERVQYRFRNVQGRGGNSDYFTKIGQRQFRMKLLGLLQSVDLTVRGGDFSTRTPLRIEVVEPPQIDQLTLHVRYPEYTGLNSASDPGVRQGVAVLGSQISLPAGTDFLFRAQCNKPLQRVRIQTERFEISLERGRATGLLTIPASVGNAAVDFEFSTPAAMFDADGAGFQLPALLSTSNPAQPVNDQQVAVPIRFDPESVWRIVLHDTDDIMSAEPVRVTINSIPDKPPLVETRLRGIGTSITRQATIPIVGDTHDPLDATRIYGATDDYGVAEVHFEYRIEAGKGDQADNPLIRAQLTHPADGGREYVLDERFKVLPLDLSVGQRLVLKVVAADNDLQTGPHVASGTVHTFQIVSDDELLALVATKELNIRRRFEQTIEEIRNSQKNLLLARTRLEEARPNPTNPNAEGVQKLTEATNAAIGTVERITNDLRKNANETQSIELEFGDIRDELENNAVPDVKPTLERINGGILSPLHSINVVDYNQIDDSLALLRRALEESRDAVPRFDESVDQISRTIQHLEAVLAQMLKLETVNEALQMLRDIIKAQEELQDKTRKKRKTDLIEGLQ